MPKVTGAGTMLACREYAGLPVLLSVHEGRAAQFVGLDAAGAVAWRISLGERMVSSSGWTADDAAALPRVLPPFVALPTYGGMAGLVTIVDMNGRKIVNEVLQNLPQWSDASMSTVDGRTYLRMLVGESKGAQLGEPRRFSRLLATIDGASGTIEAGALVLGALELDARHIAGGQVWLAAPAVGEGGSLTRTRLDGATMRADLPVPAGLTVEDGTEDLRLGLLLGDGGPPWRVRPGLFDGRVAKSKPSPPDPPSRRIGEAGPTAPTWARGPIDAAAARVCEAPAGTHVELMAWEVLADRRGSGPEYAFTGLEYTGERGRVWCLALLIRSEGDEWEVYHGSSHVPRRLRLLQRRPTGADADKFLNSRWIFSESYGQWVVEGDIIDAAWQAVTGEPPTRFLRHKQP